MDSAVSSASECRGVRGPENRSRTIEEPCGSNSSNPEDVETFAEGFAGDGCRQAVGVILKTRGRPERVVQDERKVQNVSSSKMKLTALGPGHKRPWRCHKCGSGGERPEFHSVAEL
jgi:hypothetical protein